MTLFSLVAQDFALVIKTKLNCVVTIIFNRLNLKHNVWRYVDYRNWNQFTVVSKNLSHADLFT